MTNAVKIKLRAGVREIEVEGPRADVDALLERWWNENDSSTKADSTDAEVEDPKVQRQKKKRSRPIQRETESNAENTFDANALANQIKERQDFDRLTRKVIHAKGDRYNKVALVLWAAGEPLTSGQIHRVLDALDIRISLPNVSDTLKANMNKFLTSVQRRAGGPPASYRLSGQAKVDFEKWLAQNEQ